MINVSLTVQSKYNGTLENATLQFVLSDSTFSSQVAAHNIPFFVFGILIGVIAIVVIIVGFLCRKKKKNQSLANEMGEKLIQSKKH